MKIKILKGNLKDKEFTIDDGDIDENGAATICGRAYCVYLPKDCYEVIELSQEDKN